MRVIAVYVGDEKHPLQPIARLLDRANQALRTLERYKDRLDEVSSNLSALEVEDIVTLRDVVMLLQRTEMVSRIAEEIEGDIVELGIDGRLIRLQLEEVMGHVELDYLLVVRDYFHEEAEWHLQEVMGALSSLDSDALLDPQAVAETLHLP
jgi:diadenylate cyclase